MTPKVQATEKAVGEQDVVLLKRLCFEGRTQKAKGQPVKGEKML